MDVHLCITIEGGTTETYCQDLCKADPCPSDDNSATPLSIEQHTYRISWASIFILTASIHFYGAYRSKTTFKLCINTFILCDGCSNSGTRIGQSVERKIMVQVVSLGGGNKKKSSTI